MPLVSTYTLSLRNLIKPNINENVLGNYAIV